MEEIIKNKERLGGYPENIRKALNVFLNYVGNNKYGKHIIKTYNIGFIGVASELNKETIIDNNPICNIFEKYYPNIGTFSIAINKHTERIFPCYIQNGEYHNFTEDMIANKEMWDEMAECVLIENTYEYEEDLPMNIKYMEYKQKKTIKEYTKPNEIANSLIMLTDRRNNHKKKWYQFWKC